ncbi:high-affinity ammonia permease [Corynebacterium vitaeruminis DSM 20294]|uniref:Ammonium transporter n=1 Tax=Corynebacterium vitaeruminis DSM 20294 TaxID=1224164 RepID=W5XX58_9CORY|nr:high-affinity ammonia permease [Corynebacterium vitaeruminis DSM 20294]
MTLEAADIAWILTAIALVTLMFPGLSFLYGGMLGQGQVLNMTMMVMGSLSVTAIAYVAIGHGLVLGNSVGGLGIIGNPSGYIGFSSFMQDDGSGGALWGAFYFLFAAISLGLVASGAAGRMRYGAWLIFGAIWLILVYAPMAHWVFAVSDEETGLVGGWMRNVIHLHDFAGGTAVHMNAGASGLALALVLGPRKSGLGRPHNLPLMMVGIGMLMAGWLGFNGGTAGGASFLASYVVLTSLLALSGGALGFVVIEHLLTKKPTMLGFGTGIIAGLVGITPAADAVSPIQAVIVGFLAAAVAAWAISWKKRHRIDDSLDVFAVHGMAGVAGALFVMLFGNEQAPAGVAGVLRGGDINLLWHEPLAIIVTLGYCFGMSWLIATCMSKVMKIRITEEDEANTIDLSIHAETAYDMRGFGPKQLSFAPEQPASPSGPGPKAPLAPSEATVRS